MGKGREGRGTKEGPAAGCRDLGEGPGRDRQQPQGLGRGTREGLAAGRRLRYHLQRVGGWQSDALPHTFLIEELQGMVSARPLRVVFQVGCLFFDNSRVCFGWGSCIGCPSEHLGCHRGSVD